jgi:hypothetical protein
MIRLPIGALLAAGLLAACSKPTATPEVPPPAAPAGEAPAPTVPPPASEDTPPPPADAPTAPAQPSPDAPPPTEPSPAPKPTSAANEPALESMKAAIPSAKAGVPVDLRYTFDGAVAPDLPVVLHLAAVPRVTGSNLKVTVKQVDGLRVSTGGLEVQKASASSVYRQQLSVTRLATGPAEIRVLVTMGVGEGSSFGFFSIPLDSVKQR